MLVAAYLVGGFLIASVYAVGMLRGRRDRYHRLGFLIAFTVAAIATPVQMLVGDKLARWVYNNEPREVRGDRARAEDVERRARDAVRSPQLERRGGAVASRSPASRRSCPIPARVRAPWSRASTRSRRTNARRTREVNVVHLAWDVMVGLGTLLLLLVALVRARRGCSGATCRRSRLFLWLASAAGVLSIVAMEAGWVVTEVGRQPWIVSNYMKVEAAATTNEGVWVTFLVVLALYIGVAVTLILILRVDEPSVARAAEARPNARCRTGRVSRCPNRHPRGTGRAS